MTRHVSASNIVRFDKKLNFIQTKTGTMVAKIQVFTLITNAHVRIFKLDRNQTNTPSTAVKFRLVLDMKIFGLPGSRSASTQISNANCPVELAMNAA